jgi:hypothetical protein
MNRTLLIGDQVSLGTTSGDASSISNATVVRLFNGHTDVATVSMTSGVGAAGTVTFTMPAKSVEFLEKAAGYVIWASDNDVKANKVGFTG